MTGMLNWPKARHVPHGFWRTPYANTESRPCVRHPLIGDDRVGAGIFASTEQSSESSECRKLDARLPNSHAAAIGCERHPDDQRCAVGAPELRQHDLSSVAHEDLSKTFTDTACMPRPQRQCPNSFGTACSYLLHRLFCIPGSSGLRKKHARAGYSAHVARTSMLPLCAPPIRFSEGGYVRLSRSVLDSEVRFNPQWGH
ncbi:hypothetical protein VTO73DRAFT_10251 [Trametes versicolor]